MQKKTFLTVLAIVQSAAVLMLAGCGGSGESASPTATTPETTIQAPSAPASADGIALYNTNCAGCHGALATSSKKGITVTRLQTAISANIGGMGPLSTLSQADLQAIVNALSASAASPSPTPTPAPAPAPEDGATLYATNCAGCHGTLASSTKQGTTLTRLQTAIAGNIGGMGFLSTLTAAQQQAIVTALAVTTPAPTPAPAPAPAPVQVDGATLYGTNCAGCHGTLASSTKAGATATRIQTAITGNVGGMGYLSTLTAADVQAIATALATVTPPSTPAPTPSCGSCHAIPPATGHHSTHINRATCATCHGTGYSTTTVNTATHNNGIKNLTTTIGWNATSRSCSNSCHGTKSW